VGDHRVPFNVKATRWLGIYLDSRLSFRARPGQRQEGEDGGEETQLHGGQARGPPFVGETPSGGHSWIDNDVRGRGHMEGTEEYEQDFPGGHKQDDKGNTGGTPFDAGGLPTGRGGKRPGGGKTSRTTGGLRGQAGIQGEPAMDF
jgi:hypothetical protein